MLIRRRLPGDVPDTIEAKQPEIRTQPKIPVGRLGNGADDAFGKAVADPPRHVRVLADFNRRIQGERARPPRHQHASQHSAQRDNASSSSVRSRHISHYYLTRLCSPPSLKLQSTPYSGDL